MDGMGSNLPWTKTSIVRHVLNMHPQFNAYAVEQLMSKYNASIQFSNRRVYISAGGVELSHVLPTLVLGDVVVLLSWVESLIKRMCDEGGV